MRSEWDPIEGIERSAMRGLDGNYINTQGDITARMQVAFQAEQYRQQIRAQLEAADTLRKLREEVEETEKKPRSSSPLQVGNDMGSGRRETNDGNPEEERSPQIQGDDSSGIEQVVGPNHIDVRV